MVKKCIKDCITVRNGIDYDVGRILWVVGVLAFIGLSIGDLCLNGHFSAIDYGTGLGVVLAGGGVALKLKDKTEPQ